MTTEAQGHYEVAAPRPEPLDAPASPPVRGRLAGFTHYAGLFRRSIHLRFRVANLFSGLLPDFASGAVRGRFYRWAGFEIAHSAFLMGKLRLPTAAPGFYEKLSIGPGVTIADNVTINLDAKVTIGKNVAIAPHVLIYTGSHKIGPGSMRIGEFTGLQ